MFLIHYVGAKSFLPQMALPTFTAIHQGGVGPVRFPKNAGQPVSILGYDNQVNVIWHQAIRPGLHAQLRLSLRQNFNICVVI
jgi:hypothetical protein